MITEEIQFTQLEACRLWGITIEALLSDARIEEINTPRRAAMAACATVFECRPCIIDRAFNRENGATRNAIHSKKQLSMMDEMRGRELLITCEQHKRKMLSKELVS